MKKVIFGFIILILFATQVKAGDLEDGEIVDIGNQITYTIEENKSKNEIVIKLFGISNLYPEGLSEIYYNIDGSNFSCAIQDIVIGGGGYSFTRTNRVFKKDDYWYMKLNSSWLLLDGFNNLKLIFNVNDVCHEANKSIVLEKPSFDYVSKDDRYKFEQYNGNSPVYDMFDGELVLRKNKFFYLIGKNYPYDNKSLKIKVGLIRDVFVLESLQDNSSDAMESLLAYAKNDQDGIEKNLTQAPMPDPFVINYEDWDLKDNALYYCYAKYIDSGFSDTDGIIVLQYRDVDGHYVLLTDEIDYSIMSNALYAVAPDNNVDDNPNSNNDVTNNTNNTNNNTNNDTNNNANNDTNNDQIVNKPVDTGTVDNPGTGLYIGIGLIVLLMFMFCLSKFNEKKIYKI